MADSLMSFNLMLRYYSITRMTQSVASQHIPHLSMTSTYCAQREFQYSSIMTLTFDPENQKDSSFRHWQSMY